MSLHSALMSIKTGNPTLNGLIGTRFTVDMLDQKTTLPAVCFQVISRTRDYPMGVPATLSRARVQIDGYASSALGRIALAAAIRHCFNRYRGTVGSDVIYDVLLDGEFETIEQPDTEARAYRTSMDFLIHISET